MDDKPERPRLVKMKLRWGDKVGARFGRVTRGAMHDLRLGKRRAVASGSVPPDD